jgi:hypothetical protein
VRFRKLAAIAAIPMLCHHDSARSEREPGIISVWRNRPIAGGVQVFANGSYVGVMSEYVLDGRPACGGTQTLNFSYLPGRVTVVAKSSDGRQWMAATTVQHGECSLVQLPVSP